MLNVQDDRVKGRANVASYHKVLIAVFDIKLKSLIGSVGRPHHKFYTDYLKNSRTNKIYDCEIQNK